MADTQPTTKMRPPIVVVMGHVDHGKTSLLDFIRKSRVAEKESGGITQAIGAYQIEEQGKKITFIDTPGHEAFTEMRKRGARVADIAVLVVAGDEGVKPQTEEAIRIIKEQAMPFVVAINKIDRPNADENRTKQSLAEKEVLVEGYGGTVPAVAISAKTGEKIPELLETILLLAELEHLETDPAKPGTGVIIESHRDPKRGATATLLLTDGTVSKGEFIVSGSAIAPVRIFENFLGETTEEAHAADPVRLAGFSAAPTLGEVFISYADRKAAEAALVAPAAKNGERTRAGKTIVNIILKTDVLGSKEAIEGALGKIGSEELGWKLLRSEAGDINEDDVKLAVASANTFIIGFKVKVPATVKDLAERQSVTVITKDIIYELLDAVKETMVAMAPAELKRVELGSATILALFKAERGKQVIGGRVGQGVVRNRARFEIIRNQRQIGTGRILSLQSQRKTVDEVNEGGEFGVEVEADISIAAGDTLKMFAEEKITPSL